MGHHRSAGLFECLQKYGATDRNWHYIQHHNSKKNPLLHSEFNFANGIDFISLCARLLLARWSWRKGDIGHQYFAVTGCVPVVGIENFTANIACVATHRQVFAVHIYHEHGVHFGDCRHYQLEFPWAAYASNANMDSYGFLALFAGNVADEATTKDSSSLDDGNAGHEHATAAQSIRRIANWIAKTYQVDSYYWKSLVNKFPIHTHLEKGTIFLFKCIRHI